MLGDPILVRGAERSSRSRGPTARSSPRPVPRGAAPSTLPTKGRFLFKNKGNTGVPHFVILQQVVEGTTTDQVLEYLQSEEEAPPPSWVLQASLETGSISPGGA